MNTSYEKINGSILGGIIGDALGFLVEGHDSKLCSEYVNKIVNTCEIFKFGRGYNKKRKFNGPININEKNDCIMFYPFGQYTDDSQLTIEIIDTIIESNGNFNYEIFSKKLINVFKNNKIVGGGSTTKQAALNLYNGANYLVSGVKNATTNGTAMRSGIFGLLYSDDINNLIEIVTNQSMMTHRSSTCSAGAVCIAVLVAMAYKSNKVNINEFLKTAYDCTKNIDITYANNLKQMPEIIKMPTKEAYNCISNMDIKNSWGNNKISSSVICSTMFSIYCFMKHSDNYMNCIREALMIGGDVDTVAKMAGDMVGALLGIKAIPKEFIDRLNDNGKNTGKDIQIKGFELYKIIITKKFLNSI